MQRPVYLDWNATTPPHPDVVRAMSEATATAWGNPASVHATGRAARARVEDCREEIAALLGVHPRDVLFTSGGTEANNCALNDAAGVVTSRLEHPSIVRAAEALERAGRPVHWLPVPARGCLEPDAVAEGLASVPRGSWVALTAVNHETGVVQPVPEVVELARRAGARVFVDAAQAVGKIEPKGYLGADRVALAAHKLRGPKGIGALAWRSGLAPMPILHGGAQERGLRPGTVNAVAAAGFSAALRWARTAPSRYAALEPLRDDLERRLGPYASVNGAGAPRAPHVTNLSFTGARGDELVAALDLAGVQISSGSACSAGTSEPSPVVSAMLGGDRARSAVRISMGDETSAEELERLITALFQLLEPCADHALR